MRVKDVDALEHSDVYDSIKYQSWKYGDDDEYNRDKSTELPWCVPLISERAKVKACANLQTRNIR